MARVYGCHLPERFWPAHTYRSTITTHPCRSFNEMLPFWQGSLAVGGPVVLAGQRPGQVSHQRVPGDRRSGEGSHRPTAAGGPGAAGVNGGAVPSREPCSWPRPSGEVRRTSAQALRPEELPIAANRSGSRWWRRAWARSRRTAALPSCARAGKLAWGLERTATPATANPCGVKRRFRSRTCVLPTRGAYSIPLMAMKGGSVPAAAGTARAAPFPKMQATSMRARHGDAAPWRHLQRSYHVGRQDDVIHPDELG
jgi:hypothetical protein